MDKETYQAVLNILEYLRAQRDKRKGVLLNTDDLTVLEGWVDEVLRSTRNNETTSP